MRIRPASTNYDDAYWAGVNSGVAECQDIARRAIPWTLLLLREGRLDNDLNILMMNEAYKTKIWGPSRFSWRGEVIGRPFRDLVVNMFESGEQPPGDRRWARLSLRRRAGSVSG